MLMFFLLVMMLELVLVPVACSAFEREIATQDVFDVLLTYSPGVDDHTCTK